MERGAILAVHAYDRKEEESKKPPTAFLYLTEPERKVNKR
jgi:hypothetical protein